MEKLRSTSNRIALPPEIWSEIFTQTATVNDAVAWAEAYGVVDLDEPIRTLARARAPSLLAIYPKPTLKTFQPAAQACRPKIPDLDALLEIKVLCDADDYDGSTNDLYHLTAFLLAFAPRSAIAEKTLGRATLSWVLSKDYETAASIAECEIACHIESVAKSLATAVAFDLALGPTRFPPYLSGLGSIQAVLLHNLTLKTDLSALLTLPNLSMIEVDWGSDKKAVDKLRNKVPKHVRLFHKRDTPSVLEKMTIAARPRED